MRTAVDILPLTMQAVWSRENCPKEGRRAKTKAAILILLQWLGLKEPKEFMGYTIEIQCSLDIDWFAVYNAGLSLHFASGGGRLPTSVALDIEENKRLVHYFRILQLMSERISTNPRLSDF